MLENKIEFKVEADVNNQEVNLRSMSPKAAIAFTKVIRCMTEIVNHVNPDIKIEIFPGSLGVRAVADNNEISTIATSLESLLNRQFIGGEEIVPWRKFQDLIKENGLEYSAKIFTDGVERSYAPEIKRSKKFTKRKARIESQSYSLEFTTGKLIEVGGKRPNIHIEIENTLTPLKVECGENSAKKAMPFLYNTIMVSYWEKRINGIVREHEFCDVYATTETFDLYRGLMDEIESTEDPLEKLSLIHDKCREIIEYRDLGFLSKFLRMFRHASTDVNTLNTILMITASFKNNNEIRRVWGHLKEFLDYKIKYNLE